MIEPDTPPAGSPTIASIDDASIRPLSETAASDDAPLAAPASLSELFFAFNRLALQGFGGVLPVAQRELVERHRWLTKHQFVEMLAVSQVLPGPNVVNLALMFGDRTFGLRGAMAALAGMLLVPMIVVLMLTALYGHYSQYAMVTGALRGMGAVASGLIISTGLKLLGTMNRNAMGMPICLGFAALTIVGTTWLHLPLVWVILGLGSFAIAVAWTKLRR
jgi:chromate transporter